MTATLASMPPNAPGIAELDPHDVYAALQSRPSGLSADEAAVRFASYGPNTLPEPPKPSWLVRFGANFVHVMAMLLWVGGAIAFVAQLPELGVAIWIVNIVNGLFSSWQEFKADRATEALRSLLPLDATVLRDGQSVRVPAQGLVPGDVVLLAEGDRVSADGRLVDHVSLRIDQSTLTGESRPVRKASEGYDATGRGVTELPNLVFAGTNVATGRGSFVVTATGSATEFGRVAAITGGMAESLSPLQIEMKRLSYTVSVFAVVAGVAFFVIALGLSDLSVSHGFIFALGMIVAFVPEGLLPTVTLALAMGTQRMAHRSALVKRLSAVETLGAATVICTDKTGTLTQNEMTVRLAAVPSREYRLSGVGYEPVGSIEPPPDGELRDLLTAAALACNARLLAPDADRARWGIVGDPTEGAILVAAAKAGIEPGELAGTRPRVAELPFDPTRKRMSCVNLVDGRAVVSVKGAPAELLARSTFAEGEPGRARMTETIERYASQGLRVLGVARRQLEPGWVPPRGGDVEAEDLERDLEFLGLVAMEDPPRPEVADAVAKCRTGGIRIIMVTGDYGPTAATIGRRIGVLGTEARIIDGVELQGLTDGQLDTALDDEVLFARATPEQKLRVVTALQRRGDVVAVTGDGVNDAPALKRADIGIAMGLAGTDVAKEAADVVLLDDNFATIVSAVEEGRAVYANIRKFTTYILTSNTPEAVPFIVYAFARGRIPLALDVMHILAIDLGTDLAPALALGAEPVEPGVMDQPPRRRTDHVIDKRLLVRAYLWLGLLQSAAVMAAFFGAYRLLGYPSWLDLPDGGSVYRAAAGMALAMVVATQIGNLFAQRSRDISLLRLGLGGNRLLWWGIATEIVVIVTILYVPFLGDVIGTAPFPAVGWLWLLLGIPLLPLADEVRKAIDRRRTRSGRS